MCYTLQDQSLCKAAPCRDAGCSALCTGLPAAQGQPRRAPDSPFSDTTSSQELHSHNVATENWVLHLLLFPVQASHNSQLFYILSWKTMLNYLKISIKLTLAHQLSAAGFVRYSRLSSWTSYSTAGFLVFYSSPPRLRPKK